MVMTDDQVSKLVTEIANSHYKSLESIRDVIREGNKETVAELRRIANALEKNTTASMN